MLPSFREEIGHSLHFLPQELVELTLQFRGCVYYESQFASWNPSWRHPTQRTQRVVRSIRRVSGPIKGFDLSPNGRYLCQISDIFKTLNQLFDLQSGQYLGKYSGRWGGWSPDGSQFALITNESIAIYPTCGRGEFLHLMTPGRLRDFSWSSHGLAIFSGLGDEPKIVEVYRGGEKIYSFPSPTTRYFAWETEGTLLQFSPNQSYRHFPLERVRRPAGLQESLESSRNPEEIPIKIRPVFRPRPSPSGERWVQPIGKHRLFVSSLSGKTWSHYCRDHKDEEKDHAFISFCRWSSNESEILLGDAEKIMAWNYQTDQFRTVITGLSGLERVCWIGLYGGAISNGHLYLFELAEGMDLSFIPRREKRTSGNGEQT